MMITWSDFFAYIIVLIGFAVWALFRLVWGLALLFIGIMGIICFYLSSTLLESLATIQRQFAAGSSGGAIKAKQRLVAGPLQPKSVQLLRESWQYMFQNP